MPYCDTIDATGAVQLQSITAMCMSADGQWLFAGRSKGTVDRYAVLSGGGGAIAASLRWEGMVAQLTLAINDVACNANGTLVALCGEDTKVLMVHVPSTEALQLPLPVGGPAKSIALDPVGEFAAATTAEGAVRVWELKRKEGVSLAEVTGTSGSGSGSKAGNGADAAERELEDAVAEALRDHPAWGAKVLHTALAATARWRGIGAKRVKRALQSVHKRTARGDAAVSEWLPAQLSPVHAATAAAPAV